MQSHFTHNAHNAHAVQYDTELGQTAGHRLVPSQPVRAVDQVTAGRGRTGPGSPDTTFIERSTVYCPVYTI